MIHTAEQENTSEKGFANNPRVGEDFVTGWQENLGSAMLKENVQVQWKPLNVIMANVIIQLMGSMYLVLNIMVSLV